MKKDFVGAEDVSVAAVGVVFGIGFPFIFSLPEGRARAGLGGKLQRPGSDNGVPFQPKTRKETCRLHARRHCTRRGVVLIGKFTSG